MTMGVIASWPRFTARLSDRLRRIAGMDERWVPSTPVQLRKQDFNVFLGGYEEYRKQGFSPRNDTTPVRLKLPLDWNMDPLRDRNWRFQLQAWRMLQPIWAEFYDKDWGRLKSEVLPWVRDWYDYHVRHMRESEFMWYDMATGLRAQHLALLIHLHQRGDVDVEPDELNEVEELAALHIEKLRNPFFIRMGNHGIFQLVGLRLLGVVWAGRRECKGEEAYSCDLMAKLIEAQFGPQGVHVENFPDYHAFALAHFRRIRPELFPGISDMYRDKLAKAEQVAPWFTLPNGMNAALGDSEKEGAKFNGPAEIDAISIDADGDRIVMRDLTAGGYAIVRSGPNVTQRRSSMLIVKGQAFTKTHAHADHLSFEFFAFGRALFVDSGKFSYNWDEWRQYFESDRAHNVVGLQGTTFNPGDTGLGTSGLSSAKLTDDGAFVIHGKVKRGEFFEHARTFTYCPGRTLLIEDEIRTRDDDVPIVYFHLAASLDAHVRGASVEISSMGACLARLSLLTPGFRPKVIRGQTEPSIQGWISPSYKTRIPATVVEFTGEAGLRHWCTKLELFEPTDRAFGADLPNPLPSGVLLGFPYSFLVDRQVALLDGRMQRRVVVEYMVGNVESIDRVLAEDLPDRGFRRLRSRPEKGGIRVFYMHDDGSGLTVMIRPAASRPVRVPGASGSVYLAFTTVGAAGADSNMRKEGDPSRAEEPRG